MTDNPTNTLLAQLLLARHHPPETGGVPQPSRPQHVPPFPGPEHPAWLRGFREQERHLDELQNLTPGSAPSGFGSRLPSHDAFEPPSMRLLREWERQMRLIELQRRMDSLRRPEQWPLAPPNYEIPQDFGPLNNPHSPPVMPMPPRPPRR